MRDLGGNFFKVTSSMTYFDAIKSALGFPDRN